MLILFSTAFKRSIYKGGQEYQAKGEGWVMLQMYAPFSAIPLMWAVNKAVAELHTEEQDSSVLSRSRPRYFGISMFSPELNPLTALLCSE